jgi:hypothetical protein
MGRGIIPERQWKSGDAAVVKNMRARRGKQDGTVLKRGDR